MTTIAKALTVGGASLRESLVRLANWWASELLAMLPGGLRERMQRRARRLLVEFDGKTARFGLWDAQRMHEIASLDFGANAAAAREAADEIRKACDGRVSEIAVRLSATQALRRTVTMPLATERNLRAVLAFEMDRYTPFKADHVYYDFAVLARDADKRTLQVALTLVPRKEVDPLVQALRGWGLEPTSLEVHGGDLVNHAAGGATGLNLLPAAQRGIGQARAGWRNRALAVCAALLLVAAFALPFAQKMQTVQRLEKELEEVRKEALLAEQVRKELEQLVAEENALVNRRNQRPAAIQVLQDLTQLVPDSTWLNHLELAGARVKIRGESANASELVTTIENSAMFKGATFDGSVTRDPKSDRERFAISATANAVEKR